MFVAMSGVAGYWHAGNIDWRLVLALSPGAIVGRVRGREGDGESARAAAAAAVRSVPPLRRVPPAGVAGIGRRLAGRRERPADRSGVWVRRRRAGGRAGRGRRGDLRPGDRDLRARRRLGRRRPAEGGAGSVAGGDRLHGRDRDGDESAAGGDRHRRSASGSSRRRMARRSRASLVANAIDARDAEADLRPDGARCWARRRSTRAYADSGQDSRWR